MKLKNITHAELAKQLGISRPYLTAILNRKMRCSIHLAQRIEDATKGRIKATTICPELVDIAKKYIAGLIK